MMSVTSISDHKFPEFKYTVHSKLKCDVMFIFIIAAVIGRTIACGQLCMHITCNLDLGGKVTTLEGDRLHQRICWSVAHAYYVNLNKKFPRLKILLGLLPNIKLSH